MNGQSLLIQALVYLAAGVFSVPIAKRLGMGSGEEDNYVMAVRDAASTMGRLLKADMDTLKPDTVDEAWDVTSLNEELREDAWSHDPDKP